MGSVVADEKLPDVAAEMLVTVTSYNKTKQLQSYSHNKMTWNKMTLKV